LFTGLPGRYDLLAELLSFGQNRRWRREMVDRVVPAAPQRVLDVAFYDVFPLARGVWGITLGDVCGKGPRAASVTAAVRYASPPCWRRATG
jgi:hypothetical protein